MAHEAQMGGLAASIPFQRYTGRSTSAETTFPARLQIVAAHVDRIFPLCEHDGGEWRRSQQDVRAAKSALTFQATGRHRRNASGCRCSRRRGCLTLLFRHLDFALIALRRCHRGHAGHVPISRGGVCSSRRRLPFAFHLRANRATPRATESIITEFGPMQSEVARRLSRAINCQSPRRSLLLCEMQDANLRRFAGGKVCAWRRCASSLTQRADDNVCACATLPRQQGPQWPGMAPGALGASGADERPIRAFAHCVGG